MNTSTSFDKTQDKSLSTSQKGHSLVLLLIVLFLLIVGGVLYFKPWNLVSPKPQQIFCTQEAKICPDGSAVGRTGPNCEFSACPSDQGSSSVQTIDTSNWKIYKGSDFTFKYPIDWDYYLMDSKGTLMIAPKNIVDNLKSFPGGRDGGSWETMLIFKVDGVIPKSDSFKNVASEPYVLNNQNATLYSETYIQDLPGLSKGDILKEVLIKHSDYYLNIELLDYSQMDIFNQILSTFTFTDQNNNIFPTPTCFPRPACLDTTPRCMMPEPAEGWCK